MPNLNVTEARSGPDRVRSMKSVLLLLLVFPVLAALGQEIPKCTKSGNTNIYIEPSSDMSYISIDELPRVRYVPNAAPFKSVEFDALLKQSIIERVHNV